ncbi:MAG: cell division protein FtsA [Bacteroidales bacterium]|nr:cell division protein FtsA [Bacteroidales bacterium]
MKHTEQIIGAIDVGTTKIVTVIGKINDSGKLEILSLAKADSKGVKRGVVQNIEETVASIRKTVEEAELKAGVKLKEVFVGIAGQHIKSMKIGSHLHRDSLDEEITREDLQRLEDDVRKVPLDIGESIIHVIPQSYVVDNESGIKNPVGMLGRRIEGNFHLVIANMAMAKNLEKCVNRVGLKVKYLMLEPIASAEAVLTEEEKEAGVALVDIGGGTTDIAVYHDFVIAHTAVIPFGGNIVTEDIKKGCAILQRQAEQLKVQFGSTFGELADPDKVVSISGIAGREPREISFRNLAYIIQFRMEEIIDKVYYEVERSGVADRLSAGFVFTGGGALIRHLPQFVKFRTGMDVRIGFPSEHLAASTPAEYNHPIYSTAIGLLLKGYEYLRNHNENITMGTLSSAQVIEQENVEEKPKPEPTVNIKDGKKKPSLLDTVRRTFSELFEEDDTKM